MDHYCTVRDTDGTHGADTLPGLEELRSFDRMERDPTFRWSMRVYQKSF
ncbi:hypothetical protein [Escherichia coli]|nr:hypothetical protein [Escherichia coli]MBP2766160.1 hypothetical protein [Escherichia coli]